jgi:hypothetical protein
MNWESERRDEMLSLLDKGVIPVQSDLDALDKLQEEGKSEKEVNTSMEGRLRGLELDDVERPYLMGIVAAAIKDVKPAKEIIDEMVKEAVQLLQKGTTYVTSSARL